MQPNLINHADEYEYGDENVFIQQVLLDIINIVIMKYIVTTTSSPTTTDSRC